MPIKKQDYNKKYHKDYREANAKKISDSQKRWYSQNKHKAKNRELKNKYNITLDEYNSMLYMQEDRCLICRIDYRYLERMLCVDHNHETGKVRGLLCDHCNMAIGLIKDDILIAENLVEYLKIFKSAN